MISLLATILWFLLALGILVTFHEFGHFYVARRCGVKVHRFSIGFGKPLITWYDKHGTEFVVAAIPLGGYVKMLDEREDDISPSELPNAFTQKTVWQRMAIISAGPIANFILAIVFYFALAMLGTKGVAPVIGGVEPGSLASQAQLQANDEIVSIDGKKTPTWTTVFEKLASRIGDSGAVVFEVKPFSGQEEVVAKTSLPNSESTVTKTVQIEQWLGDDDRPDLLSELGLKPYQPQTDWVVTQVLPGGAAEVAGLLVGDQLVSADQKPLNSWSLWVDYVKARPNQPIDLEVMRDSDIKALRITPEAFEENGQQVGRVGIATSTEWPSGMVRQLDYSVLESIGYGFSKTWDQAIVILSFLKKLILLDVSVKNMGGTFTIAQVAGDTAAAGLTYYLSFLAFFSVSLGVFNLLPIPVLDGGHLMFYIIEAVKGTPLSEKIQLIGYQVGLFIVVSLMIVVHYNDLVRILS